MDPQIQRNILNRVHSSIRNSLQIEAIFSYLKEQELLSDHEADSLLNPFHTRVYKINCLLQWIPQKGRDALHRFIVCLQRSSNEAIGHRELATLLERRYAESDPNETPPIRNRITCGEFYSLGRAWYA